MHVYKTPDACNGQKNWETWNVMVWIEHSRPLYEKAVNYVKKCRCSSNPPTYREFIRQNGLTGNRTPDHVSWLSKVLDYPALDEMLADLID